MFLSGKMKIHGLTNRKRRVLEKLSEKYTVVFEESLVACIRPAVEMLQTAGKLGKSKSSIEPQLKRLIDAKAHEIGKKHGLIKSLRDGCARALLQEMSATLGAMDGDKVENASFYAPRSRQDAREDALERLRTATTLEQEAEAADALLLEEKAKKLLPLTFVRASDCRIVRLDNGRLAVRLLCIDGGNSAKRTIKLEAAVCASTNKLIPATNSFNYLTLPLECSRWHEYRFLRGEFALKSAMVGEWDGEWYLIAQFSSGDIPGVPPTGAVIGVDRGVRSLLSASVLDREGRVLRRTELAGNKIQKDFHAAAKRRAAMQKRGLKPDSHYRDKVDYYMHNILNDLVALAIEYGAVIVLENLDGLKAGGKSAAKIMRSGRFEELLKYKLEDHGLPKARLVFAGGTSQTCSSCGHRAKENREKSEFKCVECGYEDHADMNAATVIGRRGILLPNMKKGQKFDELHKDMVQRLVPLHGGCGIGRAA